MTSVVGILNKRGAAIAADSAVTRVRGKRGHGEEKVTKNGNKMVRLSDVNPIAVMITGNAEFLRVPWDVIVRRYRQKNGMVRHATVESTVKDFFNYIAVTGVFWNDSACNRFLRDLSEMVFYEVTGRMGNEDERRDDGSLIRPAAFKKAFLRHLSSVARKYAKNGSCPQFIHYSIEEFRAASADVMNRFFEEKDIASSTGFGENCYPKDVLDAIRPAFEETLLSVLGSRLDLDSSATLVFVGYGEDQEYPSLIPAVVCEGYASRVNYSVKPDDIIHISDDKPVAICPFAQKDVIKSLLRGIHAEWSASVMDSLGSMTNVFFSDVFVPSMEDGVPGSDFFDKIIEVETKDLQDNFVKEARRMLDRNQREWEKALEKYDLEEMAALADSLINLTGFHRVLTFSQEGVGGLVDIGVISKNEGFTWLRRKSWYHKDEGGKNGLFGI